MRVGAVVVGWGLVLSGCGSASDYDTKTAQDLQQQVLALASAANARDYATAVPQLAQLQQTDDADLRDGKITVARHDAIAAALGTIRADLAALQAADQQANDKKHGKSDGEGNGNGNGGD